MTEETKNNVVDMNEWLIKKGKPPKIIDASKMVVGDVPTAIVTAFMQRMQKELGPVDPNNQEQLRKFIGNGLLLKMIVGILADDMRGSSDVSKLMALSLREEFGIHIELEQPPKGDK